MKYISVFGLLSLSLFIISACKEEAISFDGDIDAAKMFMVGSWIQPDCKGSECYSAKFTIEDSVFFYYPSGSFWSGTFEMKEDNRLVVIREGQVTSRHEIKFINHHRIFVTNFLMYGVQVGNDLDGKIDIHLVRK